jgi:hypothetical protein
LTGFTSHCETQAFCEQGMLNEASRIKDKTQDTQQSISAQYMFLGNAKNFPGIQICIFYT